MEDDQNVRQQKCKMTKNGKQPRWKTTKMEDDQNGRQPK